MEDNAILHGAASHSLICQFFFRDGAMFFEATAVLMAEIFKFFTCLLLVFNDEEYNFRKYLGTLHETILVNKVDTFKVKEDVKS